MPRNAGQRRRRLHFPKPRSVDLGAFRSGARAVQGRGPRPASHTEANRSGRSRAAGPVTIPAGRPRLVQPSRRQSVATAAHRRVGHCQRARANLLPPPLAKGARLVALRRTAPMQSDLRLRPQTDRSPPRPRAPAAAKCRPSKPRCEHTSPAPVHGGPASPIERWRPCHRGAPVAVTVAMGTPGTARVARAVHVRSTHD